MKKDPITINELDSKIIDTVKKYRNTCSFGEWNETFEFDAHVKLVFEEYLRSDPGIEKDLSFIDEMLAPSDVIDNVGAAVMGAIKNLISPSDETARFKKMVKSVDSDTDSNDSLNSSPKK